MMQTLAPFDTTFFDDAIRIWNAALHTDHPINHRFLSYNIAHCTGETIAGRVALQQGEAVGFILACVVQGGALGWISAIAVHPSAQRQGVGSSLLAWAEAWIEDTGCKRIRVGGNLRPFLPGLPYTMREYAAFFEKHGYQRSANQPYEYDLARSLKDYQPRYKDAAVSQPLPIRLFDSYPTIAPMRTGEESLLLDFLHREYPGRWEFEAREFVKNNGRASDFLLLQVNDEAHGFCRLTLSDSERPIERFYPQRLPQPWGQFGPLGLSKSARGLGLGGYLIDVAALHMRSLGVDGCVVDWTSLVNFYGKFGFNAYNQYISLFKALGTL